MLSPNLNTTTDQLAQAYSTVRQVDAFAFASMNTLVGKLNPDPDWLPTVRQRIELLSEAGELWQQKKPQIWAPILTQFTSYSTLFSGFAQVSSTLGNDKEAWMDVLTAMSAALATGKNIAHAAQGQFTLQINNLNNIRQVLDSSIATAWSSLASEEQAMIDLAVQITSLQDQLNGLEGSFPARKSRPAKASSSRLSPSAIRWFRRRAWRFPTWRLPVCSTPSARWPTT